MVLGRWPIQRGRAVMRAVLIVAALLVVAALAARATPQARDRAHLAAAVDSIVAEALKDGRAAGMSVAVVRGRDTLVLKGYGTRTSSSTCPLPNAPSTRSAP